MGEESRSLLVLPTAVTSWYWGLSALVLGGIMVLLIREWLHHRRLGVLPGTRVGAGTARLVGLALATAVAPWLLQEMLAVNQVLSSLGPQVALSTPDPRWSWFLRQTRTLTVGAGLLLFPAATAIALFLRRRGPMLVLTAEVATAALLPVVYSWLGRWLAPVLAPGTDWLTRVLPWVIAAGQLLVGTTLRWLVVAGAGRLSPRNSPPVVWVEGLAGGVVGICRIAGAVITCATEDLEPHRQRRRLGQVTTSLAFSGGLPHGHSPAGDQGAAGSPHKPRKGGVSWWVAPGWRAAGTLTARELSLRLRTIRRPETVFAGETADQESRLLAGAPERAAGQETEENAAPASMAEFPAPGPAPGLVAGLPPRIRLREVRPIVALVEALPIGGEAIAANLVQLLEEDGYRIGVLSLDGENRLAVELGQPLPAVPGAWERLDETLFVPGERGRLTVSRPDGSGEPEPEQVRRVLRRLQDYSDAVVVDLGNHWRPRLFHPVLAAATHIWLVSSADPEGWAAADVRLEQADLAGWVDLSRLRVVAAVRNPRQRVAVPPHIREILAGFLPVTEPPPAREWLELVRKELGGAVD